MFARAYPHALTLPGSPSFAIDSITRPRLQLLGTLFLRAVGHIFMNNDIHLRSKEG